jgi:hypothetical protein
MGRKEGLTWDCRKRAVGVEEEGQKRGKSGDAMGSASRTAHMGPKRVKVGRGECGSGDFGRMWVGKLTACARLGAPGEREA